MVELAPFEKLRQILLERQEATVDGVAMPRPLSLITRNKLHALGNDHG